MKCTCYPYPQFGYPYPGGAIEGALWVQRYGHETDEEYIERLRETLRRKQEEWEQLNQKLIELLTPEQLALFLEELRKRRDHTSLSSSTLI